MIAFQLTLYYLFSYSSYCWSHCWSLSLLQSFSTTSSMTFENFKTTRSKSHENIECKQTQRQYMIVKSENKLTYQEGLTLSCMTSVLSWKAWKSSAINMTSDICIWNFNLLVPESPKSSASISCLILIPLFILVTILRNPPGMRLSFPQFCIIPLLLLVAILINSPKQISPYNPSK